MQQNRVRRLLGGVAMVAAAVAVAGCARNSSQQQSPTGAYPPPPPAASTTPPPAYGSTRSWTNPRAPAAGYSVTSALHLRSGPGVNNTILVTLPPGTQVQATGSQQGGWWEVQTPDGTGWVSSHYLAPT